MRLFIAIEVPSLVTAPNPSGAPPAPEHLTLRFLGEVASERLPGIRSALERAAGASAPFEIVLDGVGAFPSPANPRVVWVGVTAGHREVCALAERVAAALATETPGVLPESFVPHLTLFRVRSSAQRQLARALLSGAERSPPPRTVRVQEIYLKESTLTSQGARHRTLATYPLTGGTEPAA